MTNSQQITIKDALGSRSDRKAVQVNGFVYKDSRNSEIQNSFVLTDRDGSQKLTITAHHDFHTFKEDASRLIHGTHIVVRGEIRLVDGRPNTIMADQIQLYEWITVKDACQSKSRYDLVQIRGWVRKKNCTQNSLCDIEIDDGSHGNSIKVVEDSDSKILNEMNKSISIRSRVVVDGTSTPVPNSESQLIARNLRVFGNVGIQTWCLQSLLSTAPGTIGEKLNTIGYGFLEIAGTAKCSLKDFSEGLNNRIPIRGAHICSLDEDEGDIKEITSDYLEIFKDLEWLVFFRDVGKTKETDSEIIERMDKYSVKLHEIDNWVRNIKKKPIKTVYHAYTADYWPVRKDGKIKVGFELLPTQIFLQLDYYLARLANFRLARYLEDICKTPAHRKRIHSIHLSSICPDTKIRCSLPTAPIIQRPGVAIQDEPHQLDALFIQLKKFDVEYIIELSDIGKDETDLEKNHTNFNSYLTRQYPI